MVAGPTMRGTARGTMPTASLGSSGAGIDGRLAGAEEIEDGENDEEDAARDLEVGELDAQEIKDSLPEKNEEYRPRCRPTTVARMAIARRC